MTTGNCSTCGAPVFDGRATCSGFSKATAVAKFRSPDSPVRPAIDHGVAGEARFEVLGEQLYRTPEQALPHAQQEIDRRKAAHASGSEG